MGQKCSMRQHPMTPSHSTSWARSLSKKSPEYFFSLQERWIQPCSPPSAPSRPNKRCPLKKTMQKCLQFLDYAASQDKAIVTYQASDMKLAIHSDGSYLSEPKARSRAGGHMSMAGSEEIPINNGQWGSIKYLTNHKSSDVTGRRGRVGRTVHQCQNGRVHVTDTQGNGTSATTNSHPNRQFYRTRTTYQQDPPQGIEGHGCAIQLATVPRCTGQISILLETRDEELSRLLDQAASPGQPPQVFSSPNSDITHRSRVPKIDHSKEYCVQNICQKYPKNPNLCGTNSCKTNDTCSPRCLRAQRQGCVRLQTRTSLSGNRVSPKVIPTT